MPRELDFLGMYVPTLLPIFLGAAGLQWLLDSLLGRLGLFNRIWHPALFRLSLFVCLFGGAALLVYR
ncbi:MAG: DUF1656 domain-containing protein [Nevskiaceae bacterium]|nr:MAG: DUF1656 domain-containing protein [Nevskiaceae bacterium]